MGLRKVFKKFATALKVFERFAERNATWGMLKNKLVVVQIGVDTEPFKVEGPSQEPVAREARWSEGGGERRERPTRT